MNGRLQVLTGMWIAAGALALGGPASAAAARMPAEQHQGSVDYVTGGIGRAEARLFERQMGRHRLAIELLERAGPAEEFTADARVRISDARGRIVLDARAGGPFMLVDLPPGRYSILASMRKRTLGKPVVVVTRNRLARATFEFPPRTDG